MHTSAAGALIKIIGHYTAVDFHKKIFKNLWVRPSCACFLELEKINIINKTIVR